MILVTRKLPSSALSRLESAGAVDLYAGEGSIPPEVLRTRVADKDALVCLLTDSIDRSVIDAGRKLKIIANVAVGYNNIDVPAARSRGIVVTNTPDVLTESVADFTWALILALTRRVSEGERLLRRGAWKGWALDFMLGAELSGKQLGLVGFGRIGRAVARRASAFGMRVACASRRPASGPGRIGPFHTAPDRTPGETIERTERRHADGRAERSEPGYGAEPHVELSGAYEMSFDQLLNTSDVVSLHVPLTPDTHHLIDRKALTRMKRSAYLINTARGPIVDEEALVWAMEHRLLAGAALDVYEHEPAVHPGLLPLENVLLVPHLGSATVETRKAMADLAVDNVLAVLAGRPPLTPVPA